MNTSRTAVVLGITSILGLSGCADPRIPAGDPSQSVAKTNGCNQDWLSDGQFRNAVAKEIAMIGNQDLRLDHQKRMVGLQEHADILLELEDPEPQLKVLHSSMMGVRTNVIFPVSNLGEFLLSAKRRKPIKSVAIILPPIYDGKTPEIELMRDMDAVLCNAGVKQRVFETCPEGLWYGLQSPSD
jgi:hypothetical protein